MNKVGALRESGYFPRDTLLKKQTKKNTENDSEDDFSNFFFPTSAFILTLTLMLLNTK